MYGIICIGITFAKQPTTANHLKLSIYCYCCCCYYSRHSFAIEDGLVWIPACHSGKIEELVAL